MAQKALLALEDGTVFEGESFGAQGECSGEVVFNTSMSGYQEVITDPSYKGQIVAMTYPLIGNYGINSEDGESRGTWLEGFVVKELSRRVSNWRSEMCLHDYLLQNGVVGIQGIDTRELTMHIRDAGAMRSVISTEDLDPASLTKKAAESPGLEGRDLVKDVTIDELFESIQVANIEALINEFSQQFNSTFFKLSFKMISFFKFFACDIVQT